MVKNTIILYKLFSVMEPYKKKRPGQSCEFAFCKVNKRDTPGRTFFKFPTKRIEICRQWVANCANEGISDLPYEQLQYRAVCDAHFTRECFTSDLRRKLERDAIPTLHMSIEPSQDPLAAVMSPTTQHIEPSTTSSANLTFQGSSSRDAMESSNLSASTSTAGNFLPPPSLAEGMDDSLSVQDQPMQEIWDPQQAVLREIRNTHTPTDAESFTEFGYDNFSTADQAENYNEADPAEGSISDAMERERPGGVMSDTLDLFGRYVSSILRQLPVTMSYTLQQKFINEAISARLDYERDHPSRSPRNYSSQPPRPRSPPVRSYFHHGRGPVDSSISKATKDKTTKKSNKTIINSAPSGPVPITSVTIKQEVIDDSDVSDTVEGCDRPTDSVMENSSSQIDIEEGRELSSVKPEIRSDFELVLCNDPLSQASNLGAMKLLQVLEGETSSKKGQECKQPTIKCSQCNSKFHKTADLNQHIRDKHKVVSPSLGHTPPEEGNCSKRPRFDSTTPQETVSLSNVKTWTPPMYTKSPKTSSADPPVRAPFDSNSSPVSLPHQKSVPPSRSPVTFDVNNTWDSLRLANS